MAETTDSLALEVWEVTDDPRPANNGWYGETRDHNGRFGRKGRLLFRATRQESEQAVRDAHARFVENMNTKGPANG